MKLFILTFVLLGFHTISAQHMTYQLVDETLKEACDSVAGGEGAWQLLYRGRVMLLIADESHNRMRIISPIIASSELSSSDMKNALTANFHSVLDTKYAISEDLLWSTFIHPLKELSIEQLEDALSQVFLTAETFGTTYQSTDLIFPSSEPSDEKPDPTKEKKRKL